MTFSSIARLVTALGLAVAGATATNAATTYGPGSVIGKPATPAGVFGGKPFAGTSPLQYKPAAPSGVYGGKPFAGMSPLQYKPAAPSGLFKK